MRGRISSRQLTVVVFVATGVVLGAATPFASVGSSLASWAVWVLCLTLALKPRGERNE